MKTPRINVKFRIIFLAAAATSCGLFAVELWPEVKSMKNAVASTARMDSPLYEPIGHVPRLFALYTTDDGTIYAAEDHFIFRSDDGGGTFDKVGVLPEKDSGFVERLKDRLARSKLARAIRGNQGPRNLVVLSSGTVVVVGAGGIYRSTDRGQTFELVYDLEKNGVYSPMPHGMAVTADDSIYFGEYVADTQARSIRVLEGSNDGAHWRVAHTFPEGVLRHIHSIQYDPYRDVLWICTGDRNEQSRLLYTSDSFSTVEELGGGSQDWRIVSLIVTEDSLFWGSDNDTAEGASIFRWSFAESRLVEIQYLGKPAYYSTALDDGTLLLSTTYEAGSTYTVSADPEPSSEIWMSEDGAHWEQILSLPADLRDSSGRLPRLSIAFPKGAPANPVIYSPIGTSEHDFTIRFLKLAPDP